MNCYTRESDMLNVGVWFTCKNNTDFSEWVFVIYRFTTPHTSNMIVNTGW